MEKNNAKYTLQVGQCEKCEPQDSGEMLHSMLFTLSFSMFDTVDIDRLDEFETDLTAKTQALIAEVRRLAAAGLGEKMEDLGKMMNDAAEAANN